jgi:hypothetical protein
MQLSLEHIEKEMAGTVVPGQLADFRIYLAALYSFKASEMQAILDVKPTTWLNLYKEAESVTEADRMWEITTPGRQEVQIRWILRRIDKLSSAISTKLRVMDGEARNQY